jgi:hypothetical protein
VGRRWEEEVREVEEVREEVRKRWVRRKKGGREMQEEIRDVPGSINRGCFSSTSTSSFLTFLCGGAASISFSFSFSFSFPLSILCLVLGVKYLLNTACLLIAFVLFGGLSTHGDAFSKKSSSLTLTPLIYSHSHSHSYLLTPFDKNKNRIKIEIN